MKTPPKAPLLPAACTPCQTDLIPVPDEQCPVHPQDTLDVEVVGALCGGQAPWPTAHEHRIVVQVWGRGRGECDSGPG